MQAKDLTDTIKTELKRIAVSGQLGLRFTYEFSTTSHDPENYAIGYIWFDSELVYGEFFDREKLWERIKQLLTKALLPKKVKITFREQIDEWEFEAAAPG